MPFIKISGLTTATAVSATNQFEINQNSTSRSATVAQVAAFARGTATDTVVLPAGTVSAPGLTFTGDTNTGIYSPAADTIAFAEGGVEAMRIDSNANVGIGTSGPSAPLTVKARSVDFIALRVLENAGAGTIQFTDDPVTAERGRLQATSTGNVRLSGTSTAEIYTAGSERMRIDSSGNVGISTSSPRSGLDIGGSTLSGVGNIQGNSNSGAYTISGGADLGNGGFFQLHGSGTPSGGILLFGVNGGESMRVNNTGRVSIGSAAVNALLTVDGDGPSVATSFAFYAQSGGAPVTGYVAGQSVGYSIWASNRVSAHEFNARSDARLKKDITPIPASDAWQFVQNVTPVHYKWKSGDDDGHKFGFIAQDVVKAGFPNLVGQYADSNVGETTDADGFTSPAGVMLTVNYDQIVPVLASVLRDALTQIEDLKARVAALETK